MQKQLKVKFFWIIAFCTLVIGHKTVYTSTNTSVSIIILTTVLLTIGFSTHNAYFCLFSAALQQLLISFLLVQNLLLLVQNKGPMSHFYYSQKESQRKQKTNAQLLLCSRGEPAHTRGQRPIATVLKRRAKRTQEANVLLLLY